MSERTKQVTDNSFELEVLQAKKLVLVDFWAEWCVPCRLLGPTIDSIAEEHASIVGVVKLNVDENPATTATYGIKGIPTLILFSEGREVERIVGAAGKQSILQVIERHAKFDSTTKSAA
jgi:thioredoxin 1